MLLVQALIERKLRRAMQREDIAELAIYPEQRLCKRPTCVQILRLFALTTCHLLKKEGTLVQTFEPEFTDIQLQTLDLLGVPVHAFRL